jgi:hypothetical protein
MISKVVQYLTQANQAAELELKKGKEREQALNEQVANLKSEVAGLKTFLDTHDTSDTSEVLAAFDDINNLAYDIATNASYHEVWEVPLGTQKHLAEQQQSFKRLKGLTQPMIDALHIFDPNSPSGIGTTLIQYALQLCILNTVHSMLSHFCCGLEVSIDKVTWDMARDIQLRGMLYHLGSGACLTKLFTGLEPQPVYARWRAITHTSMRLTLPKGQLEGYRDKYVLSIIEDICCVACLYLGSSIQAQSTKIQDLCATIRPQLDDIAHAAIRLSAQLKEKVITRDYVPYMPTGRSYRPERMDLAYNAPGLPPKDSVVGTLRLGILMELKPGRENTELQARILKPAQVITQGLLQDLLAPPRRS